MEIILDSRAFLDVDDEHADLFDKYHALETSLNKSCDRMSALLDKIGAAERYVECARSLERPEFVSLMMHRVSILKMT